MYYQHGGLRQQRTEDQTFISLHLHVDQFCKNFTFHIYSLKLVSAIFKRQMYFFVISNEVHWKEI